MNRRTFLKGLFAAVVTPSAVRVLYQPKEKFITLGALKAMVTSCEFDTLISTDESRGFKTEWNEYYSAYTCVTAEQAEELRVCRRRTKFQPPKRRSNVHSKPVQNSV